MCRTTITPHCDAFFSIMYPSLIVLCIVRHDTELANHFAPGGVRQRLGPTDVSTDGLFFLLDSVSWSLLSSHHVRRALLPNPHFRKRTCATVRSAHDRGDYDE